MRRREICVSRKAPCHDAYMAPVLIYPPILIKPDSGLMRRVIRRVITSIDRDDEDQIRFLSFLQWNASLVQPLSFRALIHCKSTCDCRTSNR